MDWNKRFMFRLGKKQSETLIEFKCPVKGYRKKKTGKLFLLLFLLVSDCLVRNDLDQGWRLWIGLFLKSWDRHWYFIALFHPAFVPSWHWRVSRFHGKVWETNPLHHLNAAGLWFHTVHSPIAKRRTLTVLLSSSLLFLFTLCSPTFVCDYRHIAVKQRNAFWRMKRKKPENFGFSRV